MINALVKKNAKFLKNGEDYIIQLGTRIKVGSDAFEKYMEEIFNCRIADMEAFEKEFAELAKEENLYVVEYDGKTLYVKATSFLKAVHCMNQLHSEGLERAVIYKATDIDEILAKKFKIESKYPTVGKAFEAMLTPTVVASSDHL